MHTDSDDDMEMATDPIATARRKRFKTECLISSIVRTPVAIDRDVFTDSQTLVAQGPMDRWVRIDRSLLKTIVDRVGYTVAALVEFDGTHAWLFGYSTGHLTAKIAGRNFSRSGAETIMNHPKVVWSLLGESYLVLGAGSEVVPAIVPIG